MSECIVNIGAKIDINAHIVIGGESGSGKSNTMNALIYECYRQSVKNRLYLFDLKLVEFNRYRKILPVYTTIEAMSEAINALHKEMMDRYTIMSRSDEVSWSDGHIYIFIDELGDVLQNENKVLAKNIKNKIESIARMGRAAGVHLIVATQYVIKANVPMNLKMNCQKLVLRCNSDIGYRVIIDRKYYDLKGKGDAYIVRNDGSIEHFQVPYYSNEFVKGWVKQVSEAVNQYHNTQKKHHKGLFKKLGEIILGC